MSVEKVRKYFENTEISDKIIIPSRSSATVYLAAEALGVDPDMIAKTLSFLNDDGPVAIVTSGLSRIDNKKYKAFFLQKAKMIAHDDVEGLIGFPPGGVCPFAVNDGVRVYLDESLKKYDIVYPAAGDDCSAIKMTILELEKYVTNFCGWADVSKMPEE